MLISIVFEQENSFTEIQKEFIRTIIKKHAEKVVAVLKFKKKVLVFQISACVKNGVSGFSQSIDLIKIAINANELNKSNKKHEELIEQFIYIIYHEMHHVSRGYVANLPEDEEHILIGSIISEGLADAFAEEQYPSNHILQKNNVDFDEIREWIEKIGEVMWNKESDDDSWLYGGKGKPEMLGYKVGRFIIKKVKENNRNLDSVKLVKSSFREILKLSGIKSLLNS